MKPLIFIIILFLVGCVTREYITPICIRGDGNTVLITVKADVPKDYDFNTDVGVIP